jgi:hypothetical protein
MSKTEEKLKNIVNENLEKHIEVVNDRIGGAFFYGVIVGIVLSYSGFLGYIAGVGTGVMLSSKYKFISYQISDKATLMFNNIMKNINKKKYE